jgi:hypothetical protein
MSSIKSSPARGRSLSFEAYSGRNDKNQLDLRSARWSMGIEPSTSDLAGSIDVIFHAESNTHSQSVIPPKFIEGQVTSPRPPPQPMLQPCPPPPPPPIQAGNITRQGFASSLEEAEEGKAQKFHGVIFRTLRGPRHLRNIFGVKNDDNHSKLEQSDIDIKHVTCTPRLSQRGSKYRTVCTDFQQSKTSNGTL